MQHICIRLLNESLIFICEWEVRVTYEPTNKCRTDTEINISTLISINEIGRHVSLSMREERQSKVDAFAVMQTAGEQLFVIHETF